MLFFNLKRIRPVGSRFMARRNPTFFPASSPNVVYAGQDAVPTPLGSRFPTVSRFLPFILMKESVPWLTFWLLQ